jgi:translocation and assembly module TamB
LLGSINMAQLQIINKDLLATGMARLDATVRGAIDNPQVNGTLQLTDSSLYFGDLPTGIDNVNGSVLFDRNRATIQTLEGESGGGRFSLAGFVGFGGQALVYRLQAAASGVRVRYPEGASTTVNANLSLTGTSEDSLLGGGITIVRAGFNPRVDFASMLAETSRANAPASPSANSNEYLRGMQFDLRIESAAGLEFQTSLTKGLRAEVDLRLRGNLVRPSLLGNVAFSEGEIQLFGNRYTLNRGDIRFFNPTKIEPTFDLEAETRARGITVNVSFSGTPRKMNAAYRSDPPMQPSEIIALLATGRDPNVNAGLATSQSNTQSTLMQGVGSLVGEAVASSLNGRLQKFFGVTRIKIDPQLTGVENIPQARLTLEQQVSKDITLTFITNLTRTQEQIVRIQWDLSRQWSAVAVREENGLFGLDFQFRKRFK